MEVLRATGLNMVGIVDGVVRILIDLGLLVQRRSVVSSLGPEPPLAEVLVPLPSLSS